MTKYRSNIAVNVSAYNNCSNDMNREVVQTVVLCLRLKCRIFVNCCHINYLLYKTCSILELPHKQMGLRVRGFGSANDKYKNIVIFGRASWFVTPLTRYTVHIRRPQERSWICAWRLQFILFIL